MQATRLRPESHVAPLLLCPTGQSKLRIQREGKDRCHLLVGGAACTYKEGEVLSTIFDSHLCRQSIIPTYRNHQTTFQDKALSVSFLVVVLRTECSHQNTHS